MGKKKQLVGYDKEAMQVLANHIRGARQPMKEGGIPELKINLDNLEDTVRSLPKKEREVMEKFWGLIPGTPIKAKGALSRIGKDAALKNMMEAAYQVISKLISIEYFYRYDSNAAKLIMDIMSKIDKTGYEEMSDIDAIKYFIIFLVFFAGGHQMVYETEGIPTMTDEEEKVGYFDKYALLKATWESTTKNLPDRSISLRFIILAMEMFDIKEVIAMKRYVWLPIEKEYEDIETEPLGTFEQIRIFKEKLFPYGAWDITCLIIYGNAVEEEELKKFGEHFDEFRASWKSLRKFQSTKVNIVTTQGKKRITSYDIEGLKFTDIYEVMFLYICRNYLP